MDIKTIEVSGFMSSLHAMRNPMDSWDKSDTTWHTTEDYHPDEKYHTVLEFVTGESDHNLSVRLQKAGPEHCKHLRMIMVWADITAPRYWWTEFDTYRAGVEKVSCSTMHRLMARPLSVDDFEMDDKADSGFNMIGAYLNDLMDEYRDTEDPDKKKAVWRHIIQTLPQSYMQKRTVMMSYAALRNIYRQREGHKLKEWQLFREWVESLPESWMITE